MMTVICVQRLLPRLRWLNLVVALLARYAMTAVVSLGAVVGELELLGEEIHAFVNRRTGELYGSTSELLHKAEQGDDEEFLEWEVEMVDKLREILGSEDWMTRQVVVADDGAGVVEDADVHGPGVQVDAAVESVLGGVETHQGLLGLGGA
jgi:hypothetical protein